VVQRMGAGQEQIIATLKDHAAGTPAFVEERFGEGHQSIPECLHPLTKFRTSSRLHKSTLPFLRREGCGPVARVVANHLGSQPTL